MKMTYDTWQLWNRFTRKLTRATNMARQISIPTDVQNIIKGDEYQIVVLKNPHSEKYVVALCGIDGYPALLDSLNENENKTKE